MDGEGGEAIERVRPDGDAFDLPSVLAQLDADEPSEQRDAVETIRRAIADRPDACLPTVPKLRGLLARDSLECHELVAGCLADLAVESTADVAPSTEAIVAFVADNPSTDATGELLRCLETVAADQPTALAGHASTLADVLEQRPGYDRHGLRVFDHLSREQPSTIEPAVPVLVDALCATPTENGVVVLSALGRLARTGVSLPTPASAFVEPARTLVDHEETSLRRNAVGCLADVARRHPAVVEPATDDLATALEHDDAETRANATVALARVASGTDADLEDTQRALLTLLEDEDYDRVRANACVAIGHAELEAATTRLERLAYEDPNPDVRERARWALDQLTTQ
ncbi:HEAT repeat domain-containing protein [Natronolimnohabitans innermongolicus]|uniref:Uncharacterized protein n=1 Tax=Natronolimnohabitans innermongolicus JCM 12255 TaxID=1227499 RepID=L9XK37_9EURY|nr:HEAT repeat domain-containing protein [Natronolimnohabitans innermongolicus]ELY62085.1 hypothetical protein C493_00680 [Natronolimnohabitans innermongolicus JCM 12255]